MRGRFTMNTNFRARLLISTSAILILSASAYGQEGNQPVMLGKVKVEDTALEEGSKTYKASRSLTATKTDTPLIDVPQAVNVVTVKQIEDQAANSIGDAIRYVPGVFSSQGEN